MRSPGVMGMGRFVPSFIVNYQTKRGGARTLQVVRMFCFGGQYE